MAKHNDQPRNTTPSTTYRDLDGNGTHAIKSKDWKRDRWEQRNAKTVARRNVTGGF